MGVGEVAYIILYTPSDETQRIHRFKHVRLYFIVRGYIKRANECPFTFLLRLKLSDVLQANYLSGPRRFSLVACINTHTHTHTCKSCAGTKLLHYANRLRSVHVLRCVYLPCSVRVQGDNRFSSVVGVSFSRKLGKPLPCINVTRVLCIE